MKHVSGIAISLLLSVFTLPALAAGDAEAGKAKAAVCAACHSTDGNSVNPIWPKLAGQHASYLFKQLDEFKDGTRSDPTMLGMTAALSKDDMHDLAAYFSSQKIKTGQAKPEFVELGRKIFTGGIKDKGVPACMACHGPNGKGNPTAKFPAIAGQHSAYTIKALKDFQRGDRVNDVNKMMRATAFKMTPREMTAVAEYVSGLH